VIDGRAVQLRLTIEEKIDDRLLLQRVQRE